MFCKEQSELGSRFTCIQFGYTIKLDDRNRLRNTFSKLLPQWNDEVSCNLISLLYFHGWFFELKSIKKESIKYDEYKNNSNFGNRIS